MRLASDAFNNGCASVGIVSTACSAAMAYYGGVDPVTKRKLTTTERTFYVANVGLNIAGGTAAVVKVGKVSSSNSLKQYKNVQYLNPNDVRFSQNTVLFKKMDRITGETYTYNDLVENMRKNGWQGDAVDIVKMPDGA